MHARLLIFVGLGLFMASAHAETEVPNCRRAADMAAALRAGNTQRFLDLSSKASALEIRTARVGESLVPSSLGPSEVEDAVLRACLKQAEKM